MFLLDNKTVVFSASDLSAAASCEWSLMRSLDARLGRIEAVVAPPDDMLERTARLGDAHELRMLEELRATRQVVEIARPAVAEISVATEQTTAAFHSAAEVVFQAAFFDGQFLGYADFIIRNDNGEYEVYDTKLARHAKITALLQLAAYSDQLQRSGIPIGESVHLLLGDRSTSTHQLRDILPVYRRRRARLEQLIGGRVADSMATEWGDARYSACGRCAACEEQVIRHRDVLLVAGMRNTQRARLRAGGVETVEQLAVASAVDGMSDSTLATLRGQAQMQLAPAEPLAWLVVEPSAFAAMPAPDDGDVFFDFEGDPLYQEGAEWGLDYLFGLVEADETFRPFWAHDLTEERQALIEFLDYIDERRARYPGMHIYHYASYERTHLLTLSARHGVGEEAVADLLREHVLVDLYPIVRRGLVIGSRSYSLKKLEPLYMTTGREGVSNAADSITEYVRARELLQSGELDAASAVLGDIATYNEYDCLSTLRLRDWLLQRAKEQHVALATPRDLEITRVEREPDLTYLELDALLEHVAPVDRTPDQTGLALAAAAIDYHRRENNSFWWDHFDRLRQPFEQWEDTRDVFRIEEAEVLRDWSIEGRDRSLSRELVVTGTQAPGSGFRPGDKPFLVYDVPVPPNTDDLEPGSRWAHERAEILEVVDGGFLIEEKLSRAGEPYPNLPMAFSPSSPPRSKVLADAIHEWGDDVLAAWPQPIPDAAFDILRRQRPRGRLVPIADAIAESTADAIRDSLLGLDHSYLAVQGPPGTGKTYTGSHVIAGLVRDHGWKIGVVAQSHAAVENVLAGVIKAGLDPALVGKVARPGDEEVPWTALTDSTLGSFTDQPSFVVGGTAWLFANAKRIPRDSLDLLVIDEAGQYSLANTIAASVSAERLLLLGDPQQLPQVSQGTHPEPVDVSALGWLSAGHDVLPPEFGYFLANSWRMHSAVCAPVSALSYEGKLVSRAPERMLSGIEPGLHPRPIAHSDNSTSSIEEADAVVGLVRDLLGRAWTDRDHTAPLAQDDIIVVAPYNAQVELIRERLVAAGLAIVPVGTVDKFQGREAAVSIVSLAASSAADVPRGLEFLLLANRLNVAISRAQWSAYLLYSPSLTEYLPTSIAGLAQLSAFLELVGGG